jgi:hypothetical protein
MLKRLIMLFLHLDLCACHSIIERLPADQWLQNIQDHFVRLWVNPPPAETIKRWLDSRDLYDAQGLALDQEFRAYVQRLSDGRHLHAALARGTNALFYSRFVLHRIWMLRERRDVHHLAMQDIPGAFEMNLGIMAGDPQPENANALVGFLNQQMVMPQLRLSRTLVEARLLRDHITDAFGRRELDQEILPSLRQRMRSLSEHYEEAWRLLNENADQDVQLLDPNREVWLWVSPFSLVRYKRLTRLIITGRETNQYRFCRRQTASRLP